MFWWKKPTMPQENKKKPSKPTSTSKGLGSARSKGSLLSLESRLMFDAAAGATAAEVNQEQVAQEQAEASVSGSSSGETPVVTDSQELLQAITTYLPTESRHEIVFVDPTVPDYQELLSGMDPTIEVVMLAGSQDGIEQMANAMSGRTGIDAVHIISHGGAGELQLGTGTLTLSTMSSQYADELAAIKLALSEQADILVYGCDFAEGDTGQAAVNQLAALTGADVQASSDLTGNVMLGGDWDFEVQTGGIETQIAISYDTQVNWLNLLSLTASGSETRINTTTTGTQTTNSLITNFTADSVAMDASGNYVTVWESAGNINGQRYNSAGTAQGGEFVIASNTATERLASVAMNASGAFVVTWERDQGTGDYDIYARLYNSSGSAMGSEFLVNETTTYHQEQAKVAMDANGNFLIVWDSNHGSSGTYVDDVYAQRYNSTGTKIGSNFVVNTTTAQDHDQADVAMDSAGNFVVVWESERSAGSNTYNIYGQRYNSSGVAQGGEFLVNSVASNTDQHAAVAMNDSGNFVVTWDRTSGSDLDIQAQRFNSSGVAQGSVTSVTSNATYAQDLANVAMDAGGNFVVSWSSITQDGSGLGIYTRQYDNTGTALTTESRVNTTTSNNQDFSGVAYQNGKVVVTWSGEGTGDTTGFFMQRYDAAGGNAAPTIISNGGGVTASISVAENSTAVTTVTATDADAGATLTYSISGGADASKFTINSSTGALSFITAPNYESPTDSGGNNVYDVMVTVTDGVSGADSQSIAVTVTNTNDAPVNSVPSAQSTNEDTSKVFSSANGNQISIADPDSSGANFEVTMSVTNGTLTLAGTTGLTFVSGDGTADSTMTLRGTATNINTALNGLSYSPTADFNGGATLTISTRDNTLVSLDIDANLQARYTFEGNANDVAPGTAQNGTLGGNATYVTDGTRGQVLSLDGVDDYVQIAGRFGDPVNVTLTAWVNLTAADSLGSHVISLGDSVLLTVDEPSLGNGVSGVYYNGSTWVKLTTGQFIAGTGWHHIAYIFDDTNNTNTLYIDGTAVATATASASISYTQGINSFIGKHGNGNTAFDFNGKVDDARVYSRALSASEVATLAADLNLTDTDSVAVTVTAANDGPSFSSLNGTPTFTEGGSAVVLDSSVTITDTELTAANNFNGATLTLTRNGGANSQDVFSGSGTLSLSGGNVIVGGTTIGTYTNSGGTLAMTFNSNATNTLVNSAMQQIAYSNSSDAPPISVQINWTFNDGNSGSQGTGGALTATGSTTVSITTVNDAPVNSVPSAQSTNEDTSKVFSSANGNQISIADPDSSGANFEVTMSVTNGTLTLAGTTGLTFVSGDGTADSTMTLRGTATNINTALNGLSYSPTADFNGGATLTISTRDNTLVSLDIDANLQARYTFEGNANDVAPDTAQNGTLTNGASIVTDGTRGQVLSLDGVDDYVQITGLFGNPTDVTLAAWVNLTAPDTNGASVISLGDSVSFRVDDASQYLVGFVYDGSGWQEVRTSAVVAGTGWRHVAFSFSDSGNLGTVYLDGTAIGTATITASINYTLNPNSFIGKHGNGNTTFDFNGTIDDARVYNRALSAAEVATLAGDLSLTDTDTVAVTVNAVNDSPTIGGGSVPAINEDTTNPPGATISSMIGGTFSDPDAGASPAGVLITNNPLNAAQGIWQYSTDSGTSWHDVGAIAYPNALALSAGTSLRFLPAANYNGSPDILSFRGLDNTYSGGFTNGATKVTSDASSPGGSSPISSSLVSFTTLITAVNDAPVLADTVLTLTVAEDAGAPSGAVGSLLSAFTGGITDVDASAVKGIAITGTNETNGTWYYTTNGGTTWTAVGAVSNTSALLLADNANTRLYFAPSANYSGTSTGALTLRAWDQTSGTVGTKVSTASNGGTTAFSSATDTVAVTVSAFNDAPTFAVGDGSVVTPVGSGHDYAFGSVVQPDGKIIAVGYASNGSNNDFALVRYNADGTLDTSFGIGGKVSTAIGTGDDRGRSVALQVDGKVLVGGYAHNGSNYDFAIARYNADGSLDTNFGGGDGIVTTAIGSNSEVALKVLAQADGKLVLAGYGYPAAGSNNDMALVRYNSDGSLDTTFGGGDGIVTTAIGTATEYGRDAAIQTDGKIVLVGSSWNGSNYDMALVRYNSDGSLDTGFGTGGKVTTAFGSGDETAYGVVIQADGKIVIAGDSMQGANMAFALARYNSDGTLDTSFGTSGKVTTAVGTGNNVVFDLEVQADGKLAVAGTVSNGTNTDFAVLRYTTSGVLDTSFSSDGIVLTDIGGVENASSLTLQSDGQLVVAGYTDVGGTQDFALVSYTSDGRLDAGFDTPVQTLNANPTFVEGGSPVVLDANVEIFDAELSAANNFNLATLTLARNGGANGEDVFGATGTLSLSGGNIVVSGVTIGTYINTGGTLTLTFNSNATNTLVNSAMQQIAYSNSSDAPPSSVQIGWTFNDGNSGSQGTGGALTATGSMTVSITAVNDAPLNTVPGAQSTNEDTNLVFSSGNGNQISVTDPDSSGASFEITLSVTNGTATLSGTTGLTFTSGDGTADSTMTLRGTVTNINAALNGLIYSPTANFNGGAALTIATRDNTLVSLDIDANLQARYTFEGNANDVAPGTAQNGTLTNGASIVTDGTRGQVLSLDGVNDYVQITGTFSNPTEITIGGWVNLAAGTGRKEFISLSNRVHIALDDGSGLGVKGSVQVGAGSWIDLSSNQYIAGTGWHHIMYSYSDSTNTHALYIDGTQVATATINNSVYWTGATDTYIGYHPVNGFYTNALIDNVGIYNRALSASEIASLANDLTLTDTDTVAVTVNAVNDSPTVGGGSIPAIAEDTVNPPGQTISSMIGGTFSDSDAGASLAGVLITNNPLNAAQGIWQYSTDSGTSWHDVGAIAYPNSLALSASTSLRFLPAANYNGSPDILSFRGLDNTYSGGFTSGATKVTFDASSPGGSSPISSSLVSFSTTINPVNDAPVLADTVLTLTVAEDAGVPVGTVGSLVSSFTGGITDVDASAVKGMAITGTNETNGTWYYSTNGGVTWTAVGTVSNTSALLLADNASTRLYFAPGANYNGTSTAALTLRAWDQTSGTAGTKVSTASNGGTTAFSSTTDTIDVTVTAVNDAPVLSVSGTGAVAEGQVYTLNLGATDVDGVTITSWTITWGDGIIQTVAGNPSSVTHTYANELVGMTLNITVAATDADGTWFNNRLYVPTWAGTDAVHIYESQSGAFVGTMAPLGDGLDDHIEVIQGPNGNLYISSEQSDSVLEYTTAGVLVRTFVGPGSGGLNGSAGMAFGPDGHLYVASYHGNQVLRYDGSTGAFLGVAVAAGTSGFGVPLGLNFGPDGMLYVVSRANNSIMRFDAETGIHDAGFSGSWSGANLEDFTFGPDGNLYAADGNRIVRLNGSTGAFIDSFVAPGAGGLSYAAGLTFGPDGRLYVSDQNADAIRMYNGTTGVYLGDYVPAGGGGLNSPAYITFAASHTVTITPTNDAPVLADTALTLAVAEDAGAPSGAVGSLLSAFTGGITDVDASAVKGIAITGTNETNGTWYYSTNGGVTWTAVGTVSNTSALLLADNASTRLYFAPAANYNGTSTGALTLRAWDQTSGTADTKVTTASNGGTTAFSSATDTVDVTVSAVNDAPVLADTALTQTVTEDGLPIGAVGSLLSAFTGGITDVDGGAVKGLAITGYSKLNGSWYYTINGGTTWTEVGTVSDTSALLLADNASTRLYFAPNPDYSGFSPAILTVRAWDQTSGTVEMRVSTVSNGGTTAFSSATDTIDVTVTAVNDAPVLADTALTLTVTEDAGAPSGAVGSLLSVFTGGITDVDASAVKGMAITGTNETNGTWYYSTNGGVTWTAVGTVSNTSALLLSDNASTRLYFAPGANYNGTSTAALTLRAWDQTSGTAGTKVTTASNGGTTAFSSATDTIDVTVSAVNDVPTDLSLSANTVTENAANGTVVGTISSADPDMGDTKTYSFTDSAGGRFIINSSTGAITVANSSLLDYETATSHSVTVRVTDSGGLTYDEIFTINVTNVDEAPLSTGGNITIAEDTTHTFIWSNFSVTDVDSAITGSTAIQIVTVPADGRLEVSNGVSWEPVTINQTITKATIDTGWLRFTPDAQETGYDGYATAGVGDLRQDYAQFTFRSVQTIPITNPDAELGITYAEGTGNTGATGWTTTGMVYTSNLTSAYYAGDHDQLFNLTTGGEMRQTLTTAFSSSETYNLSVDVGWNSAWLSPEFRVELWAGGTRLGYADQTSITPVQGSFVRASLQIDGSSFSAVHGQPLEIRMVETSGYSNAVNFDNVMLTTSPGGIGSPATMTIDVTPANDAPTDLSLSANTVAENAANGTVVGTVTGTDPDAGDTKTYSLTDTAGGRFAINSSTGQLTVADGGLLNYESTTSHNVTVRVTDAGGLTYDETFTINLTSVNEIPTNISLSGSTVAENATNGTVVGTASTTDPDTGDTHTYSLADTAGGRFAINSSTGQITVADGSLLNYESATSHNITVRTTDAGGLTRDQVFTINLTNVNEVPTGSDATVTINEDTSHTLTTANFGFSDVDAGDSLSAVRIDTLPSAGSLTLSGATVTAGQLITVVDITAGNLVFSPSADANGTGYASLTFSVRDGNNAYDVAPNTLTFDVTGVNDAPTITNLSGDSMSYSEGDGPVVIEQSGDALVVDVDSTNLDTGTLTVSIPSGGDSAEDMLSIRNQGTGAGQIGVSGSTVTYGGVTIGTFTGGSSGTSLVITLTAGATPTALTALVKNITYENTDTNVPTTGARTVRYVLTDGDGGTSANYDTTVTVSAVNDPTVVTGGTSGTGNEDTTVTGTLT
ncbi:MAG TPA: DUF4347 domain-containing protein, partial [Nitrospira sp.]|nr:DUF4347 domain-containing protein [Nitrospira sp.]